MHVATQSYHLDSIRQGRGLGLVRRGNAWARVVRQSPFISFTRYAPTVYSLSQLRYSQLPI